MLMVKKKTHRDKSTKEGGVGEKEEERGGEMKPIKKTLELPTSTATFSRLYVCASVPGFVYQPQVASGGWLGWVSIRKNSKNCVSLVLISLV